MIQRMKLQPDHTDAQLRGMAITRPNDVWATDLHPYGAWLRLSRRRLDWATRRVLSWRLSITMEAAFCVGAWRDKCSSSGWRNVKYEEAYLRAYETVGEARSSMVGIST
jgi:putative transposase